MNKTLKIAAKSENAFANELRVPPRRTWLPYGLRTWFLVAMMTTAIALAAVCISLMIYSRSHHGLGTDNGQDSVLFGWRFTPTLVAVLYVLGTAIVLNDVKRTEAYARLSSPIWSTAKSTLCRVPGPWWDAYRTGLTTGDGGINWTMLSAALLYTAGFLAISPLSSSLLDSVDVTVQRPATFKKIAALRNLPLAVDPSEDVYLRTVAHTVQGLETSAWLTDEYAILPFSPTSSSSIPLGPILTDQPQQWSAITTVFKSAMTCDRMPVTETSFSAYQQHVAGSGGGTYNFTYLSVNVSDRHGCDIRVFSSDEDDKTRQFSGQGGGSWFLAPNYTFAPWISYDDPPVINYTQSCLEREVMFVSTPWTFQNPNPTQENWTVAGSALAPNSTIVSYICDTKYYMANTNVLASTSGNQISTVSLDDGDFRRAQTEIAFNVFDTRLFQHTFLAANWTSLLYSSHNYADSEASMGGPLRLLSGVYGLNVDKMIHAKDFLESAKRVKQRFFSEMLFSAFTASAGLSDEITGHSIANEQRIVVNSAIAITLAVLLLLSGVLLLLLLLCSGLRRRPLNLNEDPSNLAAIGTLGLHDSNTRHLFIGSEHLTSVDTISVFSETRHRFSDDGLVSIGQRQALPPTCKPAKSWRPLAIKRRNGLCLLLYLCALLGTIAALWQTYRGSGLYGTALLYRADFTINNSAFAIAPYSIVPTFLAVLVGLWWGSIEQTFRRIQPYVSMTKRPTSMRHGPFLSYVSSYLVWGAWKAIAHKHWILALLCLGATFAEIFTVAMSALWQRTPGVIYGQASTNIQFKLREKSQVFTVGSSGSGSAADPVMGEVLESLYGTLETNWLYGATLQLAYNASEPPWSKDGWPFVPSNIQNLVNVSSVQNVSSDSTADQNLLLNTALVNVTLPTVATRARLECTQFGGFSNLSAWVKEVHLTNASRWNVSINPTDLRTGYELGTDYGQGTFLMRLMEPVSYGRRIQTSFFANPSRLQCCADNGTDSFQPAGIGYWSNQIAIDDEGVYNTERGGTHGPNVTTKWIYGWPHHKLYHVNSTYYDGPTGHLIWRDLPKLTALNCKPIIESASAKVTVDGADGSVQSFQILQEPTAIGRAAWNDSYASRGFVGPAVAGGLQEIATRYVDSAMDTPYMLTALPSYGFLFLDAMLHAADLTQLGGVDIFGYDDYEPTIDRTFNYRSPGLNMDFMTYAMYILAGNKLEALLDPDVQASTANKVFSTFFQHFVSSNVTSQGSWAYEVVQDGQSVEVTVARRVQMLQMSMAATAICLSILAFFIVITIVVYFVDFKHFANLQHDVDSMADVLRLMSDSPKFLAWLAQAQQDSPDLMAKPRNFPRLWKGNAAEDERSGKRNEPKVKLDMLVGTDGQRKWIVEIVDPEHPSSDEHGCSP